MYLEDGTLVTTLDAFAELRLAHPAPNTPSNVTATQPQLQPQHAQPQSQQQSVQGGGAKIGAASCEDEGPPLHLPQSPSLGPPRPASKGAIVPPVGAWATVADQLRQRRQQVAGSSQVRQQSQLQAQPQQKQPPSQNGQQSQSQQPPQQQEQKHPR